MRRAVMILAALVAGVLVAGVVGALTVTVPRPTSSPAPALPSSTVTRDGVTVTMQLDSATVSSGQGLSGTVTVTTARRIAEPCAPFPDLVLTAAPVCTSSKGPSELTVGPGRRTFAVTALASTDGIHGLRPGRYRASFASVGALPVPDPIDVTVTPPLPGACGYGCTSAGAPGATTTLDLTAESVVAGQTIGGTVTVTDPRRTMICPTPYIFLSGQSGQAASLAALGSVSCIPTPIPAGSTTFNVEAQARYLTCRSPDDHLPGPHCLAGGVSPPLPPGTYQMTVEGDLANGAAPAAISVTVTSGAGR